MAFTFVDAECMFQAGVDPAFLSAGLLTWGSPADVLSTISSTWYTHMDLSTKDLKSVLLLLSERSLSFSTHQHSATPQLLCQHTVHRSEEGAVTPCACTDAKRIQQWKDPEQ